MSEMVLRSQWFDYFSKKILKDFGIVVSDMENYQPDVSPIVYCCLLNRRVINKKRKIIYSKAFSESDWHNDDRWIKLKKIIEEGDDINCYMSKAINEWMAVDYLLYTYNVSHFHLHKNKKGGIRNELVFGVFTHDCFYAIYVGGHNDIYKPDELIGRAYDTWPTEIYDYELNFDKNNKFDQIFFKKQANIPELQFNKVGATPIKNVRGEVIAHVDKSQHTLLINLTLNNIEYKNIPYSVCCAYFNEIEHIDEVEMSLVKNVKADKMDLIIRPEKKIYEVVVHNRVAFKKSIPFRRKVLLCTLYNQ